MITHILICDPVSVGKPIAGTVWAPNSPRLDYNGVDNVLLATLWRALNPAQSVSELEGMDLAIWPDAMPLVFKLPDDLTEHLRNTASDGVGIVAQRWATDKDAQLEGLTPEAAVDGLTELSAFARRAWDHKLPLVLAMYF